MSRDYYIDIILGINFTEKNIFKVIKKGAELGFVYYDNIPYETYEDSPIVDYYHAYNNIKNWLFINQPKDYPFLYIKLKDHHSAHFWFYEFENYLQISFSGFGYLKKKNYEDPEIKQESNVVIDFKYYLDIATSIADDFGIYRLEAREDDFF